MKLKEASRSKQEMSAVEVLSKIKVICKRFYKKNCDGCIFEEGKNCPFEDDYDPATVVQIIEQCSQKNCEQSLDVGWHND